MKKFLAIIMTVLMITALAIIPVSAADPEAVKCEGWWSEWSKGYEVKDAAAFEINHTSQNPDQNYCSLVTVFCNVSTTGTTAPNEEMKDKGYSEYFVFRSDSYGWGGTGIYPAYSSTCPDKDGDGDTWDDFRETVADCKITAVVYKTENGVGLYYKFVGKNGTSFDYKAAAVCDVTDLYVFFTGEQCTMDITPIEVPADMKSATLPKPAYIEAIQKQDPGVISDGAGAWNGGDMTADKAFDNDTSTYYDCANAYGFVGMKYESAMVVKSAKVAPRADQEKRLAGCYLEGSNDGEHWTVISEVIKEEDLKDGWAELKITSDAAYQYVRYYAKAGNCNVSELVLTTAKPTTPATGEGGNQNPTSAPQTGFATIALAVAALASGAYVVSKKRH